jgi:hypothetical protein
MQNTSRHTHSSHDEAPSLPAPHQGAHWRWATGRRALVGGGVLAAVIGLGPLAAGAATTHRGAPPTGAHPAPAAARAAPTAMGRISALSGHDITVSGHGSSKETVVYSASTTFRTSNAATTSAALKVGRSIAVMGTKEADGTVVAKTIMIGTRPTGRGGPSSRPGRQPPNGGGTSPTGGPAR